MLWNHKTLARTFAIGMIVLVFGCMAAFIPTVAHADDHTLVALQNDDDPVAPAATAANVNFEKKSKSYEQTGQWIANGYYVISSIDTGNAIVGAKKGTASGVVATVGASANKYNGWYFKFDNSTKTYTIVNAKTKRALTYVAKGKTVKQTKYNKKKKTPKTQRWILTPTKKGYVLKSYANKNFALSNTPSKSVLKAKKYAGKDTTLFFNLYDFKTYSPASYIKNGVYAFANFSNGNLLQLKYVKTKETNTQQLNIGADTGEITQKFEVTRIGKSGNVYRITCCATDRVIADNGSGGIVQAKLKTADTRQRWLAFQSNDGIIFKNAKTGKILGLPSADGVVTDVDGVTTGNKEPLQHWKLIPSHTGLNAYQTLSLTKANNPKSTNISKTKYFLTIDKTAHHLIIWQKKSKGSAWTIVKDWRCTTSMHGGPYDKNYFGLTAKGKYPRQDHILEVNDYRYGAKYWSSLGNGTYIHSVLFQYQSNSMKDGRLGYSLSGGCTRLAVANAKWVYDYLPYYTGYAMYYK